LGRLAINVENKKRAYSYENELADPESEAQ